LNVLLPQAQAALLGHLFLVHGRSWQRVRPFIEAGGLGWVSWQCCHSSGDHQMSLGCKPLHRCKCQQANVVK
jgi:hypothetical protein